MRRFVREVPDPVCNCVHCALPRPLYGLRLALQYDYEGGFSGVYVNFSSELSLTSRIDWSDVMGVF
jgi:hypothetical protein